MFAVMCRLYSYVFCFRYNNSNDNIYSKNDNNIKVMSNNLHMNTIYLYNNRFDIIFVFLLQNNIFYCTKLYKYL